MIDDNVRRLALRCQVGEPVNQQAERPFATDAWKDDQPRMHVLARDQLAKVDRILGYDRSVFIQATGKHDMVRFAESSHVARMDGVMLSLFLETES